MTGIDTPQIHIDRIYHLSCWTERLEFRLRLIEDCSALKLWLSATVSLFIAWVPALCGMPL
jgi:hypothetical protein